MSADPFIAALKEWMEVSMRNSTRNFIGYARGSGLSLSHFGAIFQIYRDGTCGVTEIGEQLGVTSAAASQMLERLVQQGVVLRTEDPGDRRVKRIALTEKGRRILEEAIRARQSWLDDLAYSLSDQEKQSATYALKLLISKMNQLTRGAVAAQ
jgi:DNA-binding MarR family transcriptional regulator